MKMENTLGYLVTSLYRDFMDFSNEKLQAWGLSRGLLFFILYIGKHPYCSPGRLASDLHMDTGHTTRSIDKLQKNGFVIREKNKEDKRSYVLYLTPKGEEVFKLSYTLFEQWDNQLSNGLAKEEVEEIKQLLTKILQHK